MNFLIYLFKVSLATGLFYLVYRFFFYRDKFFIRNRFYLLGSLIVAIVAPLIVIPVWVKANAGPYFPSVPVETISQTETPEKSVFVIFERLFPYIYLAGFLFFLVRMMLAYSNVFRVIIRAQRKKHGSVTIVETGLSLTPFSVFKWVVIPENKVNHPDFNNIVQHELVHSRQYHSADLLLAELLLAFLWFNPFIWFIKSLMAENHEYIVDNELINKGLNEQHYQYSLLQSTVGGYQLAAVNYYNAKLLKKRIRMMKKTKTPGWYRAKNLLIIAIAFIVVLLTSTFETRVIAQSVKKDPVVIINGKTYDYNVVKNLDPSHIERIDVLKDSTATIVYGSKGKNGVIIIHTSDPDSVLDKSLTDNKTYELRTLKIRHADRDSVAEIKVVRNTKTGDDFFLVESKNDSVKLFTTMRSEKNSGNFNNCLVFYDDKKISSEELKKIDPSKIKKIEVLKGSVAFEKYGREAENGVVLAYSYKRNNITGDAMPKNSLFIINGREVKGDELSNINPDDISTVNVTKNSEGRAVAIKLKTTSSENNGETTALMLSPNPALDIVNISINSDDLMTNENCRITVISMEGKVVYKTKKSGKNFDIPVSKLKSGNYIVVVSTGKSSFSSNLSIVK